MRLHLKLTPNTEPIPFNYQHQLTGTLHKWLGQNDLHDKISLYSFSWLRGSKANGKRSEWQWLKIPTRFVNLNYNPEPPPGFEPGTTEQVLSFSS